MRGTGASQIMPCVRGGMASGSPGTRTGWQVTRRRFATATIVVAVTLWLAAAAPAPAAASSIFFIRAGNIWVAAPDGSHQVQLTSDGGSPPYVAVASSKQGSPPVIAWERSFPNSFGTIQTNGTALALNPGNSQMAGDSPTRTVSLDAGGDRVAFAWGHQTMFGAVSGPQSIGVDGSSLQEIGADGFGGGSSSVGVTFGDTAGTSLLFDTLTSDYGGESPSSCAHSAYELVRQVPNPAGSGDANAHPLGFYCGGAGINLLEPALRPDGQLIVASAQNDTSEATNPNLASGKPRLVTIPLSGGAGPTDASPVAFITPDGLSAVNPDFSPDGTEVAFAGPDGIYVVPAGGGQPQKIIDNASYPAWSPYTLSTPPPPPPPVVHLRLSVTAPGRQRVLEQKGLVAHLTCTVRCVAAAAGGVAIRGHKKPFTTRTVTKTLASGKQTSITLRLSTSALRAIAKALRHHIRVRAEVLAVATDAASERQQARATFAVHR